MLYCVSTALGTNFGVQDLITVDWMAIRLNRSRRFGINGSRLWITWRPGVQFDDVMLRDILFQTMEKTAITTLHNDLAHYRMGHQGSHVSMSGVVYGPVPQELGDGAESRRSGVGPSEAREYLFCQMR